MSPLLHTTRVVSEGKRSHVVCGCGWHSGRYKLDSIARAAGQRHESEHNPTPVTP
jgi:hypothetical protein